MRNDVITLVSETAPKGVFDTDVPSTNLIPCEVRSVTRNEAYQARAAGLNPSIVFRIRIAEDYNDETTVLYNNKRYRVVRTYQDDFWLELVCEKATYNKEIENDEDQNSAGSDGAEV